MGDKKSPDGFGTGTYEVLHPKGASIELTWGDEKEFM
jgi:hypothetical protein